MVDKEYCRKCAIFTLSVIPSRISAKIRNSGVKSLPGPGIIAFSGKSNALKSSTKLGKRFKIALSKLL